MRSQLGTGEIIPQSYSASTAASSLRRLWLEFIRAVIPHACEKKAILTSTYVRCEGADIPHVRDKRSRSAGDITLDRMARKNAAPVIGDLFAVPRLDGKFVLGQVMEEWMPGVMSMALFDLVLDSSDAPVSELKPVPRIISVQSVARAEVLKGYWKIVGHSHLLADPSMSPHRRFPSPNFIGASWHSGKMIEDLANAYYGLATWEPYPGRPGHLRSLLTDSYEA